MSSLSDSTILLSSTCVGASACECGREDPHVMIASSWFPGILVLRYLSAHIPLQEESSHLKGLDCLPTYTHTQQSTRLSWWYLFDHTGLYWEGALCPSLTSHGSWMFDMHIIWNQTHVSELSYVLQTGSKRGDVKQKYLMKLGLKCLCYFECL